MRYHHGWRWWLLVFTSLATGGCEQQIVSDRVKILAEHASCKESITRDDRQLQSIVELFGSPLVTRANEAHDCQPMVTKALGGKHEYGPRISLWLLNAPTPEQFAVGAVLGGVVKVKDENEDDHDVDELNIKLPASCLIVRGSNTNQNNYWRAWMVPAREDPDPAKRCMVDDTTSDKSKPLKIWATDALPRKAAQVLRFVDDRKDRYYIGTTCDGHWCLIGVKKSGEMPDDYEGPQDPWGDYQRLSVKPANGPIRPTRMWGKIQAVPGLEDIPASDFNDNYVHVADITFRSGWGSGDDRGEYFRKYGLQSGQLDDDAVVVRIKYETVNMRWRISYDDNESPRIIDYQKHDPSDVLAYGSARWRWSALDEGVWVFCPAGCCGDDGRAQ